MKRAISILFAFFLGLGAGVVWMRACRTGGDGGTCGAVGAEEIVAEELGQEGGPSGSSELAEASAADEVTATGGESVSEDAPVPTATVEVLVGDSSEPEPEITAAHVARQARRQAARERQAQERRDFLAELNEELLTSEQRKVHALYIEAMEAKNALRREIAALRTEGMEVPADLQRRLADAEAVLVADRDVELRALREAAARAAGLDEVSVRRLLEDLASIEGVMAR